jgi:hypothetical protein
MQVKSFSKIHKKEEQKIVKMKPQSETNVTKDKEGINLANKENIPSNQQTILKEMDKGVLNKENLQKINDYNKLTKVSFINELLNGEKVQNSKLGDQIANVIRKFLTNIGQGFQNIINKEVSKKQDFAFQFPDDFNNLRMRIEKLMGDKNCIIQELRSEIQRLKSQGSVVYSEDAEDEINRLKEVIRKLNRDLYEEKEESDIKYYAHPHMIQDKLIQVEKDKLAMCYKEIKVLNEQNHELRDKNIMLEKLLQESDKKLKFLEQNLRKPEG